MGSEMCIRDSSSICSASRAISSAVARVFRVLSPSNALNCIDRAGAPRVVRARSRAARAARRSIVAAPSPRRAVVASRAPV